MGFLRFFKVFLVLFFLTGSLIDMTKLTMNDAIDVLWYYGINTALDLEEVRIQYQAATYKTAHGVRESHLDPLEGEHRTDTNNTPKYRVSQNIGPILFFV